MHQTAKVNKISEKIEVKDGEVEIGMPVFMNNIAVTGGLENVREGIKHCKKMKIETRMEYGMKKRLVL